jgi:hypothetical protein
VQAPSVAPAVTGDADFHFRENVVLEIQPQVFMAFGHGSYVQLREAAAAGAQHRFHEGRHLREMRSAFPVHVKLAHYLGAPVARVVYPYFVQCRFLVRLDNGDGDVAGAAVYVYDAVAVHPATALVLRGVEEDVPVHGVYELEVPYVREEVRLHYPEFHARTPLTASDTVSMTGVSMPQYMGRQATLRDMSSETGQRSRRGRYGSSVSDG